MPNRCRVRSHQSDISWRGRKRSCSRGKQLCASRAFCAFRTSHRWQRWLLIVAGVVGVAFGQTSSPQSSDVGKFNGPGACAASSCHGGVQPKNTTRILQNEFSIWAAQDKHARAYIVLSNPVSLRMGRMLQPPIEQPNKSPKCLACHVLFVPENLRATTFKLDDGVSCENCHGPAAGWLGYHTTKDWQYETAVNKLGMYDARDLGKRTEQCLTCHLGTADKQVDHEMIAAGHPDLTFELDSFSAAMPRHWKTNRENNAPWFGVQEWAVGQAVQLNKSLQRVSRRALSSNWPEYAELDCFACHHSLTAPADSWRLTTTEYYQGRRAGVPAWNASRYVVFRYYAEVVDPKAAEHMEKDLDRLALQFAKWARPNEISSTALSAASTVDQLAQQIRDTALRSGFDCANHAQDRWQRRDHSQLGERTAEQATMAIDSLFIAYTANTKLPNEAELRAAIKTLFSQLQNPSAYNAVQFRAQLLKGSSIVTAFFAGCKWASGSV